MAVKQCQHLLIAFAPGQPGVYQAARTIPQASAWSFRSSRSVRNPNGSSASHPALPPSRPAPPHISTAGSTRRSTHFPCRSAAEHVTHGARRPRQGVVRAPGASQPGCTPPSVPPPCPLPSVLPPCHTADARRNALACRPPSTHTVPTACLRPCAASPTPRTEGPAALKHSTSSPFLQTCPRTPSNRAGAAPPASSCQTYFAALRVRAAECAPAPALICAWMIRFPLGGSAAADVEGGGHPRPWRHAHATLHSIRKCSAS